MIRNLKAAGPIPAAAVLLLFVLLTTLFGSGCGDFFVSGNSLNTISLTPASVALTVGDTKQLTANGTTVNGDSQDVTSTATWTSSAPSFATVSAGLVTAVASGSATITVSKDGVENTAGVIVNTSALNTIDVTAAGNNTTINSGSTVQLTATATFADGSTKDITNQATWMSNHTGFATVKNTGLVTGVSAGTATITASLTTATGTVSNTLDITVQ